LSDREKLAIKYTKSSSKSVVFPEEKLHFWTWARFKFWQGLNLNFVATVTLNFIQIEKGSFAFNPRIASQKPQFPF